MSWFSQVYQNTKQMIYNRSINRRHNASSTPWAIRDITPILPDWWTPHSFIPPKKMIIIMFLILFFKLLLSLGMNQWCSTSKVTSWLQTAGEAVLVWPKPHSSSCKNIQICWSTGTIYIVKQWLIYKIYLTLEEIINQDLFLHLIIITVD